LATPLSLYFGLQSGGEPIDGPGACAAGPSFIGFHQIERPQNERTWNQTFFEIWIAENIDRNTHPEEDDSGITVLAAKIIADAQAASITTGEIEEDAGPIEDCILEAIEEAADVGSFHASGG
jgi:hypothetical protein